MTDLFIAASGFDPSHLTGVVPPACRRPVGVAPNPIVNEGDVLVDLPAWTPRCPASHLLPSLSVLGEGEYGYRFEVSVLAGGAWSPWVGGATLGAAGFAPIPAAAGALRSEIDVFLAAKAVEAVRLRLRLRAEDLRGLIGAPWFVSLSASDGPSASAAPPASGRLRLDVPPRSQMEADETIRHRICSPTSLAMVLDYLGERVDIREIAAVAFHAGLDLYGIWPAAIRAAGRHGVAGYLLRFPDWAAAAWCLGEGLPIVASVRYAAGELAGAAMPETAGHLLVLVGYDGDRVLVNDPAAPDRRTVGRACRLHELERVWLQRSGVGYVFFRPGADTSRVRAAR